MFNKFVTHTADGTRETSATLPPVQVLPTGKKLTAQQMAELLAVKCVEVVQPDGTVKKFIGGYITSNIIDELKRRGLK